MRLRYLHLEDDAPLHNITIPFEQETILQRNCAIRFIVGVNGTGKSRLLRAMTQAFLHLERGEVPPFPITLIYDLHDENGGYTVYFRRPQDKAETVWRAYTSPPPHDGPIWDWANYLSTASNVIQPHDYQGADLPAGNAYLLPGIIVAYASGLTTEWEMLFRPPHSPVDVDFELDMEERPANWMMGREVAHQLQQGNLTTAEDLAAVQAEFDPTSLGVEGEETDIGYFVAPETLRLAFCAVALHQARVDFQATPTEADIAQFRQRVAAARDAQKPQSDIRGLMDEVGWLWPITLGIRLDPENVPNYLLGRDDNVNVPEQLRAIATDWRRDPDPGQGETFFFDLRAERPKQKARDKSRNTLAALIEFFGDKETAQQATAFDIFKRLYTWQRSGYLQDLTIALQKCDVDDLLLYDWLSDGEQVFLGRMALFHLLAGEDNALIILDEPETHFNDVWKRRVVDIIDDSLRDRHNEVVISTHSSIALTDVFKQEITVLRQVPSSDKVQASRPSKPTFGASPNEIMRDIFDTHDAIGQRASEYLELILLIAARPEEVALLWAETTTEAEMRGHEAFNRLVDFVYEETQYMPIDYGDKTQIQRVMADTLGSLKIFTQQQETGEMSILQTLLALKERLGTSHYEFEFSRRIRFLEARKSNASQD